MKQFGLLTAHNQSNGTKIGSGSLMSSCHPSPCALQCCHTVRFVYFRSNYKGQGQYVIVVDSATPRESATAYFGAACCSSVSRAPPPHHRWGNIFKFGLRCALQDTNHQVSVQYSLKSTKRFWMGSVLKEMEFKTSPPSEHCQASTPYTISIVLMSKRS